MDGERGEETHNNRQYLLDLHYVLGTTGTILVTTQEGGHYGYLHFILKEGKSCRNATFHHELFQVALSKHLKPTI